MARLCEDWLQTFLDYTDHMEAPKLMRSWAGISGIASALRRKVWLDQDQFIWTPSLYIVFVGPPGVITKSTTTDLSSTLLRDLPSGIIKFGPNNITWQALATSFAGSGEMFEYPPGTGEWHPMSPITLVSRELGSLLNPRDQDLVNLFIELYDGARQYEKETKMSGNDTIECPWINLLGATTPSWIADNVPRSALGGGLISRCIFLYGDEKEKMVAYPIDSIKDMERHKAVRAALVHDLEHIANLVGPFKMTPEAKRWGVSWYEQLWTDAKNHYNDDKLMGYIARKQTHLHKLAMVLSVSQKDELKLTVEDMQVADQMLLAVEGCLDKVFAQIGRSEQSVAADKFINLIRNRGRVEYGEAYRLVHTHFPDYKDFEGILTGAIRSGMIELENTDKGVFLKAKNNTRALSTDNTLVINATTPVKESNQ